jgi:hypothetical protein
MMLTNIMCRQLIIITLSHSLLQIRL